MSTYQHPSVYSQSSSLLFQFVLDEFLIAGQEGVKMSPLYLQLEAALLRHRPFREIEWLFSQVSGALAILTGSSRIHTQIYPWTPSKGALGKLKHYISIFSPRASYIDTNISELTVAVSKSYHGSLEAREMLWHLRTGPFLISDASSLFSHLHRIVTNLEDAATALAEISLHYAHNENVLYFYLKNSLAFDLLYKRPYVRELFTKMFRQGVEGARAFLISRYQERGFHHLIPLIEATAATL